MNLVEKFWKNFKQLPIGTKRLLGIGIVVAITVALPLFVWAILTQRLDLRKRASSGEPPVSVPIFWSAPSILITADDFKVYSNNKVYTGGTNEVIINPGTTTSNSTSVEIVSNAYGDTLKLNLVFKANSSVWWIDEVKVFNSNYSNNWTAFPGPFIYTTLGHSYSQPGVSNLALVDPANGQTIAVIEVNNLIVQGFTNSTPPPTACEPFPMTITSPSDKQYGDLNQTLKYDIAITHNDPNCLGGVTVNLSAQGPNGWPIVFTNNNFRVNSNTTYQTSFYVTSTSGSAFEEKQIVISAKTIYPANTATKTVTYVINDTATDPTVNLQFSLKLAGVSDESAEGARVVIGFTSPSNGISIHTEPVTLYHIGDGVYKASIEIGKDQIPTANDYVITIKGEKHLSRRFCYQQGQTQRCSSTDGGHIVLPQNSVDTLFFDFTNLALEPGDLFPQDGKADSLDFSKIKALFATSCSSLTAEEKLTADLDYSGCVNVRDAFLMRKTLETRYDNE